MLNRANFIVTEFASKEETRYTMQAVHTMQAVRVESGATIATNGHYLAWISTDTSADPASFPVVEGFEGGQKEFAPFLLDVESAKQIAKALPKKTTIPVLQYAAVHVNGVTVQDGNNPPYEDASKGIKSVSLAVRPQVFRPRVPEGQFPQYQAVIPDWEKDVAFEITVDAKYLATIAKAFAKFQKTRTDGQNTEHAPMRMKFYKQDVKDASESRDGQKHVYDRAIRFDATNGSQGMTVVLMPMRSEGDILGTYGYKERQAAREEKDGLAHMPDITLKSVIRRMKENEEYPEGTIDSLQALAS